LIEFVARVRKKEGCGRSISQILKHLVETSSTKHLHNEVADEEILSTSEVVVGEYYAGRDPSGIVEFCRYAMGIYDFQLMKDKPEKLGCTCEEVKAMHKYLRTQDQSDTCVDES